MLLSMGEEEGKETEEEKERAKLRCDLSRKIERAKSTMALNGGKGAPLAKNSMASDGMSVVDVTKASERKQMCECIVNKSCVHLFASKLSAIAANTDMYIYVYVHMHICTRMQRCVHVCMYVYTYSPLSTQPIRNRYCSQA